MRKSFNSIGDRLLGLFVPKMTASADPCHNPYYSTCRCTNYKRYIAFCCSNGGCGSCYQSGGC